MPLPTLLDSLGEMIGVIWPVNGTPDGVILLSPQSSLGTSHDRLQTLSTIDCMLHAEQVKMLSNNGEQGMFPGQNGNISLNKQSNLTHFHLPSAETERTMVPTFHIFWAEQNRNQFRPDINHRDPSMIDLLNTSASTDHRHPHPVIPHSNINTPPHLWLETL